MEAEDESTGYFRLFNDGPHNYLLQSSEDGLNDGFPVESIFTDWSTEGFPVLLNGSLITDVNDDSESASTNQLLTEETESNALNTGLENENAVAFFSNDVLLRVEEADSEENEEINGDTYAVTYEQEPVISQKEVIQLFNIDGTITTINKELLNGPSPKDKIPNFEDFYTEIKAQKCKLCSFLGETVENILMHLKTEHAKEIGVNNEESQEAVVKTEMKPILNINRKEEKYTVYLCGSCRKAYSSKDDLKQHMIREHELVSNTSSREETVAIDEAEPPPLVPLTANKLSERASAYSLLKSQKSDLIFRCSVKGCPLRFQNPDTRKQHEACHVNQEKRHFMCPVCKETFSIWRICKLHLWKSHKIDVGLLSCSMCNNFKSHSEYRVISHMATHKEEKPFICSFCGKAFKQRGQLRSHELYHRNPDEMPDFLTKKKCEQCERFFACTKNLKKHIRDVHDKFKPFICNICGHQSARKEMLESHHRQHTGHKPYRCNYCTYQAADRNCLRKHIMRHLGVVKYSCPYCTYKSIQATCYKKHLIKNHPGKEGTYSCTICKYTSVNCDLYLAHIKCHELEVKKKANGKVEKTVEDNESKSSDENQTFLNTEHSEEAVVDAGGITIPATFDLNASLL